MVKYTYRYRLYPNASQKELMEKHFGCCRYVYNHFLSQRIGDYKNTKKSNSCFYDMKQLPKLKKDLPWLKEVNSQSLQGSIEFLQRAYDGFFRRVKEQGQGKKVAAGFPKFRKKGDKETFKVKQGIRISDGRLVIPKFPDGIPINFHRELVGAINFATVSKSRSGKYFVMITVTREIESLSKTSKTIALDLNVQNIVDCYGNNFKNPLPEHSFYQKRRLLSKTLDRRKVGSKSWEKARIRLAKFHEYCHNVRADFSNKLSWQMINENQVIIVEDINVASMISRYQDESLWKKRMLRRLIQDCSFGFFLEKLKYKSGWYGRTLIKVDRWFPSSQLCSGCGWRYENLPKNCKGWECPECSTNHDRDNNAAKNILKEGLRVLEETTAGMVGLADRPDVRLA